jgi:hypothetical protein
MDISEDLDQLTNQLKTSYFELQADEATDVVKDVHLIIYVCNVLEVFNIIKLFYRKMK